MPKKILVVNDEPDSMEIVTRWLEESHYEVITAFDGLSGIAQAKEEKPDLILTDVFMPVMDGYQVCKELKKSKEIADIPIIMFTDARGRDFEARGLEAGAHAYIVKPREPRPLLETIEKVLRVEKSEST